MSKDMEAFRVIGVTSLAIFFVLYVHRMSSIEMERSLFNSSHFSNFDFQYSFLVILICLVLRIINFSICNFTIVRRYWRNWKRMLEQHQRNPSMLIQRLSIFLFILLAVCMNWKIIKNLYKDFRVVIFILFALLTSLINPILWYVCDRNYRRNLHGLIFYFHRRRAVTNSPPAT